MFSMHLHFLKAQISDLYSDEISIFWFIGPFGGREKSFSKADAQLVSRFGETEQLQRNFENAYMYVDNGSNDIDMASDDHSKILLGIKASSSRPQKPEKQDTGHQSGTKAIYPSSTNR